MTLPLHAAPVRDDRILVVDDEPQIRRLMQRILSGFGYQVLEADSVLAAMLVLEARDDIRLVITDVILPGGVSGLRLFAWLREERPEIAAMLMSGQASAINDLPGASAALLTKPFASEKLARAVWRQLSSLGETPAEGTSDLSQRGIVAAQMP